MASRSSTAALHRSDIGLGSDRVFRYLIDSVGDYAIFLLDLKGHVATWNPGAQRINQYAADEIIGKHFSIFYPKADRESGKPEMELAVATQTGRFEDEGWRLRKDGTRFWANVIIIRVDDEGGNQIGFGKITRDLTERWLAEQRVRLLIESIEDYAIYSLDTHGNVTSWNLGAQRIKGYNADEIMGQHFSRFYTAEDAAAGLPAQTLQIAEREGHYEREGWRVRKDGSKFWSNVLVTAIRDDEGSLIGFSKVTRDITDRKKLIDQLNEHARELELRIAEREQTNAELEAFSYSVSHDLRAPLRAIGGFSEALKEDYADRLDEMAMGYVNEIVAAATRMNQLVQDLLDYSRLGRAELGLQPVNISQAVGRALQQLGEDPARIDINLETGSLVLAHEATLVQVISNLLSNALKFHTKNAEPQVRIWSAVQPGCKTLRLSVRDNGIGIAPHHHERIFQVFERLHDRESYPGTGIGLAIVKRAIQRMGGTYGLESAAGEGSTFWIELPLNVRK